MSFDDPRQFTNQMAYQSFFSPPGFSFESPFGYPNMDISGNGSGSGNGNTTGNAQAGPSSMPMGMSMSSTMPMSTSMPMTSDTGRPTGMNYMGASGNGTGSESNMLSGSINGSSWMTHQANTEDKTKYDMFPGPAVNLSTGDRFSQLLERKLGMDSQSTSSFPNIDTNQQPNMPYNAFPPYQGGTYQPTVDTNNQNWDRLAVEANLQDYRQVQVHPDLVAPALPAAFFPYQTQAMPYDNKASQTQVQGQDYRTPTPYLNQNQTTSTGYVPYVPYQGGFDNTTTFPQASPLPTSNRSSPSTHSHTLITPQSASHPIVPDMSWSTQYMNAPPKPQMQGAQYSNTVPPPSNRSQAIPTPASQSIYTGYQPAAQSGSRSYESSTSAPLTGLPGHTRHQVTSGSKGAMPIAHSQSLPGPDPSTAVNMNGMWAREMQTSASFPIASGSRPQAASNAQISRSPAQIKRFPIEGLPTSLPQAPVISKRSRSPHQSQGSSSSKSHSPGTSSTATDSNMKSKRPKLSVSHPMPMSMDPDHEHDHESEHDDEEKKVVIACHTCRARKLKCDGARPKCFHCSRRNEDGCSYDVVLRRRGPGRKNKSKGKSSERSESSTGATHSH